MLLDTPVDRNKTWQPPAWVTSMAYPIRHARLSLCHSFPKSTKFKKHSYPGSNRIFLTERYLNTEIYCDVTGAELFLGRWDKSRLGPHRVPTANQCTIPPKSILAKWWIFLGLPLEHGWGVPYRSISDPQSSWLDEKFHVNLVTTSQ